MGFSFFRGQGPYRIFSSSEEVHVFIQVGVLDSSCLWDTCRGVQFSSVCAAPTLSWHLRALSEENPKTLSWKKKNEPLTRASRVPWIAQEVSFVYFLVFGDAHRSNGGCGCSQPRPWWVDSWAYQCCTTGIPLRNLPETLVSKQSLSCLFQRKIHLVPVSFNPECGLNETESRQSDFRMKCTC